MERESSGEMIKSLSGKLGIPMTCMPSDNFHVLKLKILNFPCSLLLIQCIRRPLFRLVGPHSYSLLIVGMTGRYFGFPVQQYPEHNYDKICSYWLYAPQNCDDEKCKFHRRETKDLASIYELEA